jgi:hypothetical protein
MPTLVTTKVNVFSLKHFFKRYFVKIVHSHILSIKKYFSSAKMALPGFYTCDSLRVYPLRGAPIPLTPNEWHDIAISTNAGRETFVYLDGVFITSVVADEQTWMNGLRVQRLSLKTAFSTFLPEN